MYEWSVCSSGFSGVWWGDGGKGRGRVVAWKTSRRPTPIPIASNGSAWDSESFALVSFIDVDWHCRRSTAPETNGALKEVPHPAAYAPKGYVVTMASPGAEIQTIWLP